MIDPEYPRLAVTRQCRLLGLARSTAYYRPSGPSRGDLELMRRIDELYTKWPFLGSRQMARTLRREGIGVGRKRVRRLMREMGLQAQCPKPNLSKPTAGHKIYPYLMRAVTIGQPNQAWCADITYIRLETGFVYLVAILDWHSRYVLDWELSNSLDAAFCCSTLERAIARYGPPQICNTDQGGQFTGERWTGLLRENHVKISMDGRGRALDNVFVERLWRSLKYEEVYRREYAGPADARAHIAEYFRFYNHQRPHSSLGDRTPAEVFAAQPDRQAA